MTSPAAVAALASRLGVSTDAARNALQQIVALGSQSAVDPASSAFAAIAHGAGVSPAQLAAGLAAAKQAIGGI
jgi:predicted ArsR family transcriptional regulator